MREEENQSSPKKRGEDSKGDEAKRKSKEEGEEEGQGVDETKDGQQVLDLDASSRNNTPSAQQSNKICSKSNARF